MGPGTSGISVCVYCGSSNRGPDTHKAAADALGRMCGANGWRLVFGGGRVGLMGRVADAALEAGAEVIGIIPTFLHEHEVGHSGVTRLEIVDNMHLRKQRMAELSDAFLVLPGGLGTLDETFEIVTWRQLGLHNKPVIVIDVDGYWRHLTALLDDMAATGYLGPEHRGLVTVVSDVADVPAAIAETAQPQSDLKQKWM